MKLIDSNELNELNKLITSELKKQYFSYCKINKSLFSKIKELLYKIHSKSKKFNKELTCLDNLIIIKRIYIDPETDNICVDCNDEIPYSIELSKLQLNQHDLLNIIQILNK